MHEWVHGKCIKPGGTAGVIMKCIALVPAIFCEGQGLFYFKKYSVGNSLKQKSPPGRMRTRAQQKFVAKATALGARVPPAEL